MILEARKKDVEQGIQFFIKECTLNEQPTLKAIFLKTQSILNQIAKEGEVVPITNKDCDFLNTIANRKVANGNYEEASSMFRLIIQLNCFFSPAWVNWATAEEQLSHLEITFNIYNMALEFFPYNYYIILFAAEFYASYNQKEKALQLLKRSQEKLLADGMQSSKSFEAISNLLNQLKMR